MKNDYIGVSCLFIRTTTRGDISPTSSAWHQQESLSGTGLFMALRFWPSPHWDSPSSSWRTMSLHRSCTLTGPHTGTPNVLQLNHLLQKRRNAQTWRFLPKVKAPRPDRKLKLHVAYKWSIQSEERRLGVFHVSLLVLKDQLDQSSSNVQQGQRVCTGSGHPGVCHQTGGSAACLEGLTGPHQVCMTWFS